MKLTPIPGASRFCVDVDNLQVYSMKFVIPRPLFTGMNRWGSMRIGNKVYRRTLLQVLYCVQEGIDITKMPSNQCLSFKVEVTEGKPVKGYIPWQKGKKWDEFMPKESQKAIREKSCIRMGSTPIVSIDKEGTVMHHKGIKLAAEHFHFHEGNISKCCTLNHNTDPSPIYKKINNRHKCKGILFYYEKDRHLWKNQERKEI